MVADETQNRIQIYRKDLKILGCVLPTEMNMLLIRLAKPSASFFQEHRRGWGIPGGWDLRDGPCFEDYLFYSCKYWS